MARKIVVFGATGIQGGSVVRALLGDADNDWDVVGISRNPDSTKTKTIAKKYGVSFARGDLEDPASYRPALKGAYGVFINADFWVYYNGKNAEEAANIETRQGINAVNESLKAGVKHIVFSSIESVLPSLQVWHWDSKQAVTQYCRKIGAPVTNVYSSWFFENILRAPFKHKDGKNVFPIALPDETIVPGYSAEQTGLWVRVALRDPQKWIGRTISMAGENATPVKMAQDLEDLTGKPFCTEGWTREAFDEAKKTMDGERWANLAAFVCNQLPRYPTESRELVPEAWDFKTWAENWPPARKHLGLD